MGSLSFRLFYTIQKEKGEGVFENLGVPSLLNLFYMQVIKIECKWKRSTSEPHPLIYHQSIYLFVSFSKSFKYYETMNFKRLRTRYFWTAFSRGLKRCDASQYCRTVRKILQYFCKIFAAL